MQHNENLDYFAIILQQQYRGAPHQSGFVQKCANATKMTVVAIFLAH